MSKKEKITVELTKDEVGALISCICECWEKGTDKMHKESVNFAIKVTTFLGLDAKTKDDLTETFETMSKILSIEKKLSKIFED